jgi:predicted permease
MEVRRTGMALAAAHPDAYPAEGYGADLELVRNELVRGARSPLILLLGVAGFVLLIACANAASLALARAGRRRPELTVRSALGAGRGRLARQLLTENVLLALAGGAVGLVLAYGGMDLLVAYARRFTPRAPEVALDAPVLLFTLVVSVATGLLFGAAPAAAERRSMATTINSVGSTSGRHGRRLQSMLVVVQVAVAFAVLSGAGLMLRSVWALQRTDPGFDTEEVIAFSLALEGPRYRTLDQGSAFFLEIEERLSRVPGVAAVSRVMAVPLGEPMNHRSRFFQDGSDALLAEAEHRTVGADYFRVMGVRVIEGRGFTTADSLNAPFVAVVNRRFAEEVFPGESAVGRRMVQCFPDSCNPPMTVVGVVDDLRHHGPEADVALEVYRAGLQLDWGGSSVVLRVDGSTDEVVPVIAQVVHSLDPDVPVDDLRTLAGLRADHVAPRRLTAVLLLVFAAVAVGLSLAGVFGVLTLAASARQREMGIRRAMGARESVVRTLVIREGLALVGLGLAVGLVLAGAMGTAMSGLLWGVRARDPATYLGVAALFLGVALIACYLPARKASRADVVDTLRSA